VLCFILLISFINIIIILLLLQYIGNVGEDALSHKLSTMFNAGSMLLVATFYSLVVLVNLMACVWWWIAVVEGLSQSWVEPVSASKPLIDLYNTNDGRRWVVCAYFALVTMTTIGYGDITSYTVSEMVINIIFILTSVAYFGFLLK
jgi:hypothetical protein